MKIINTVVLFIVAGLAEIAGGWLVWQWLRIDKPVYWGLFGFAVLALYGIIPTFQSEPIFGRVYAAYGGVFVVLSLIWAYFVDGWQPDRFDFAGATIVLLGVFVIMWPR